MSNNLIQEISEMKGIALEAEILTEGSNINEGCLQQAVCGSNTKFATPSRQ